MSGILNKKQRIIDFAITRNGRSQIEDGDIRYKFATFSDKSILYTKDFDESKINKANITNAEFYYLPLEVSTKVNDTINPEFDFGKIYSVDYSNIANTNEDISTEELISSHTLSGMIKNLKLITDKNRFYINKPLSFLDTGLLNNTIDFRNNVNTYPTINSYEINKEKLPVIALDKRFSNKNNYKVLIPKDISGQNLYNINQFKNLEDLDDANTTGFIYSSYVDLLKQTLDEETTREKEILNILTSIEKNNNIHKKEYIVENADDLNTLLFELHEVNTNDDINSLEKLLFINLGVFYDKISSSSKKVYLIGKIINTRNNTKDLDMLFEFNNNKKNLNSKSTFAISSYYSFVTLFTMVIE